MAKYERHLCELKRCPLQTQVAKVACTFASHHDLDFDPHQDGTYYTYSTCFFPSAEEAEEARREGNPYLEEERNELLALNSPEELIAELKGQIARRNRQIRDLRRALRK